MISDGIMPSNEGRGYVLRRLLRRAARHGRLLGIGEKFLADLSTTAIDLSKDGYPELEEKKAMILKVLAQEEDKFNKTIDQGLAILGELEEEMVKKGETILSGENAFKLYDTYGFPLDLTLEILEEKNFGVDEEGFKAAMQKQRETARNARKTTNYMGADVTVYQSIDPAITTEFIGYDKLVCDSKILVLTTETDLAEALTDGETGTIVTEQTVFYGTMGGQQGDVGRIVSDMGEFKVEDTIHLQGGKVGHVGRMIKGMLQTGDVVTLKVCENNRQNTGKNHSATHLLQKALRAVLGEHVEQAGSFVDGDRLRFDFTHFSAMTPEEIEEVETLVNEKIKESLPVKTEIMSLEEAKKSGAMALFGEKYGDSVRVVKMGDFSTELCGGTHINNTGVIGSFKILSETGIAAGVRRIEALTGDGLMTYYQETEKELHEAAKAAKTTPSTLTAKIESLLEEIKALHSENEKLKSRLAKDSLGNVMDQVKEVKGVKVLATKVVDVDMNGLRNLGDQMKDKLGDGVIVIASVQDGKVNLMATVTDEAQKKGAHAGNLIKAIASLVGGGGGGRPNMAQAGGKNPAGVDACLEKVMEVVAEQLK
jgi:alanyl-tRNA synthetase